MGNSADAVVPGERGPLGLDRQAVLQLVEVGKLLDHRLLLLGGLWCLGPGELPGLVVEVVPLVVVA